jgi:hypothetical protein
VHEGTNRTQGQAGVTPAPETETVNGEPFDAARAMKLIETLRAEIKELKPKAKQAEELTAAEQKRKEAEMTELQKLQAALDQAITELKASKISEMRHSVAAKLSLPSVFTDRLQGETLEAIEEDAKKILEALPKVPKTPVVNPTSPGPGANVGMLFLEARRAAQAIAAAF